MIPVPCSFVYSLIFEPPPDTIFTLKDPVLQTFTYFELIEPTLKDYNLIQILKETLTMKTRLLLITLGLLFICQSPLFAQDRASDASPVRVLRAALGLTEDQAVQLRQLIGAHTAAVKDNKEQIKLVQQQIEEEIHSDAPDPQIIGELVLMVSMLKQDIGQYHEDFQVAFRAMLTEEQLKKLAKVKRIALLNRAAEVLDHLKLH